MATRRKSMRRFRQIPRLAWEAVLKRRQIARSLTMSPATAGEYFRRARLQDYRGRSQTRNSVIDGVFFIGSA